MLRLNCPAASCNHSWIESEEKLAATTCPVCGLTFTCEATGETLLAPSVDASSTVAHLPKASGTTDVDVQNIGPYVIQRKLGSGTFGVVYQAHDPRLNRWVAVKVLKPELIQDADVLERFSREARAAANLNHPNIVAVYDTGLDRELYFIATAYVDGGSLADQLPSLAGQYRRIARIVRDLANALAYAHRQKIIHRDVKPANVMMNAAGEPLLMDFGLARWQNDLAERSTASKLLIADEHAELTQAQAILGTPSYMSPEQSRGEQNRVGPASDQYSLGVLLFRLLSGLLPFTGTVTEVLRQISHAPVPSLRGLVQQIPRDLEAICLKTLAKSAEDRYRDCEALAADLDRWLEGRPVTARPLSQTEQFVRWCRREPVLAAMSMGFMLAVVVGAIVSGYFAWQAYDRAMAAEDSLGNERLAVKNAQRQTSIAREAEGRADKQARAAQTARDSADERADFAEQLAYITDMQFVQQDWERGERIDIRARLDRYQPRDGVRDRRGFEWYYWDRLVRSQPGAQTAIRFDGVQRVVLDDNHAVVTRDSELQIAVAVGDLASPEFTTQKTVAAHTGNIIATHLNAQGDRLVTRSNFGEVKSWELPTLSLLQTLIPTPVPAVIRTGPPAFDVQGRRVAIPNCVLGQVEAAVAVFDVDSGAQIAVVPRERITPAGHGVQGVLFMADGERLLIWDASRVVLWSFVSQSIEGSFEVDSTQILSDCQLALGERYLITLTSDSKLTLWDLADGQRIAYLFDSSIHRETPLIELRLNRDGTLGCVGKDFGVTQLWDLQNKRLLKTRRGVTLPPEQARLDRRTTSRFVLRSDPRLWDADFDPIDEAVSFKITPFELNPATSPRIKTIAFHPKGTHCAIGGDFGFVSLIDSTAWTELGRLTMTEAPQNFSIGRLNYHPQGEGLVAAASRGRVAFWDSKSTNGVFFDGNHDAFCLDAIFLPKSPYVVSCSEARDLRIWDISTRKEVHRWVGHTDYAHEWMISVDRNSETKQAVRSLPIHRDFDIKIYRLSPGQMGEVYRLVAFSDGQHLASIAGDGTIRIWDMAQRKEVWKTFRGFNGISSLAYDPRAHRLAIGHPSGEIHLLAAESRELLRKIIGLHSDVIDLEFSPDGTRLASVETVGSVKLWDVRTGQLVLRFERPTLSLGENDPWSIDLAFHPNGRLLACVGPSANKLRVWPTEGIITPDGLPKIDLTITRTEASEILNATTAMEAAAKRAELQPERCADSTGQAYARIPNGMLQTNEHFRVIITQPYYLATTETTVAQFRRFVEATGHVTDAEKTGGDVRIPPGTKRLGTEFNWKSPGFPQEENHPVAQVSWLDAKAYCQWLTKTEGVVHRLPTEAEWEWACRAGSQGKYHFGNDLAELPKYAWFRENTDNGTGTRPVGSLLPNAWGLHDMHGNLLEWVHDFNGKYPVGVHVDWRGPLEHAHFAHVARGAAFDGTAKDCETRNFRPEAGWWGDQTFAVHHFGFRVLREMPAPVP